MRGVGLGVALVVLAAVFGASAPAHAVEVMCSSADGECTVSNDGDASIFCSCEDGGSDEGNPGEDWSGLSEAELLEICEAALGSCQVNGPDTGPGTSVGSTTSDTEGPSDTGGPGSTGDDTGADTGVGTIGTDSETDSDTIGTGTGGPGGDVESGGETGGSESTGGSASAESTGTPDASTTSPDEESSSGEPSNDDGDEKGCGCTAGGGTPSQLLALASLGLLGLRVRRRR